MSGNVRLRERDRVRCNAWLLDQQAKIPYLVSTVWQEKQQPEDKMVDRILGMPDYKDMQVRLRDQGWWMTDSFVIGLQQIVRRSGLDVARQKSEERKFRS